MEILDSTHSGMGTIEGLYFYALKVNRGDAFLLKHQDKFYLFDAGDGNKDANIVDLLENKEAYKIRIAICSHNDIDHAGGFFDLLQSHIEVDELWLPCLWANTLSFFCDHISTSRGIDITFHGRFEEIAKSLLYANNENEQDLKYHKLLSNDDRDAIPVSQFNENLSDLCSLHFHLYHSIIFYHLHWRLKYNPSKISDFVAKFDKIMLIAELANQKGCKIKWFEPTEDIKPSSVNNDFYALNSKEATVIRKPINPLAFIQLLNLSAENKHSLVFEYFYNKIPVIRFSADSDCTIHSPYEKSEVIVTAPHHGSKHNSRVYEKIGNENILWVRSDKINSSRPCIEFKTQKRKYCLACNSHNIIREIHLEYQKNYTWELIAGTTCPCVICNQKLK